MGEGILRPLSAQITLQGKATHPDTYKYPWSMQVFLFPYCFAFKHGRRFKLGGLSVFILNCQELPWKLITRTRKYRADALWFWYLCSSDLSRHKNELGIKATLEWWTCHPGILLCSLLSVETT